MASPHGDSFYCLNPLELGRDGLHAYHAVALVSALLGMAGAVHQIRIWRQQLVKQRQRFASNATTEFLTQSMSRRTWEQKSVRSEMSGRGVEGFVDPEVVVGLAYADAFACLALIVRSIMAFSFKSPIPLDSQNLTTSAPMHVATGGDGLLPLQAGMSAIPSMYPPGDLSPAKFQPYEWWYEVLGAPVEFSLIYFYVATYLWTLTYALNVYFNLANQPMRPLFFKLACWGIALIPATASMVARFYPSGLRCATRDANLYISYSSLYVPILIVMIVNPIVYIKAFARVTQVLKRTGQVTNQGRQMTLAVKYKFFLILFFFYVCWTANIVDGFLQFSKTYTVPPLGLWLVEAVLNPLQGLFNALIYGRHGLLKACLMSLTRRRLTVQSGPAVSTATEFTESDRLVRDGAADPTSHGRHGSITSSIG